MTTLPTLKNLGGPCTTRFRMRQCLISSRFARPLGPREGCCTLPLTEGLIGPCEPICAARGGSRPTSAMAWLTESDRAAGLLRLPSEPSKLKFTTVGALAASHSTTAPTRPATTAATDTSLNAAPAGAASSNPQPAAPQHRSHGQCEGHQDDGPKHPGGVCGRMAVAGALHVGRVGAGTALMLAHQGDDVLVNTAGMSVFGKARQGKARQGSRTECARRRGLPPHPRRQHPRMPRPDHDALVRAGRRAAR